MTKKMIHLQTKIRKRKALNNPHPRRVLANQKAKIAKMKITIIAIITTTIIITPPLPANQLRSSKINTRLRYQI